MNIDHPPADYHRADGKGVSFFPIPFYLGPLQYVARYAQIKRVARSAALSSEAVILRVPSSIADHFVPVLIKTGHPYGVDVVGDPHDVFSPGAVRHPLRPWFRWWFTRRLRHQCASACAAAYVTEKSLQCKYQPGSNTFGASFSDVELVPEAYVTTARNDFPAKGAYRLITVGSLEQLYKGTDILIEAIARCVQEGMDIKLAIVGDGKHRTELERKVASLGLSSRIAFKGQIPAGSAVRKEMDNAHLFALPSRTEGLPRAMMEAMARALPCIGSMVGGIPELIPSQDMVPSGNACALAQKIKDILSEPGRLATMSERNLRLARQYSVALMQDKRTIFLRELREMTAHWIKRMRCN
jgi:glycosyltransferase involved in cell wall biosynthesis